MKCEYCDNPVPNGVMRCPSCGAAIKYDNQGNHNVLHRDSTVIVGNMRAESQRNQGDLQVTQTQTECSASLAMNPYLCVDKKSHVVYVILAIILGSIGVHNFYAGYIGRGVVQLLITVLSFGLLFWVPWLWAIIEICTVEHDSRLIPFE